MNRITTAGWGVVVLVGRKFGRAWLILGCLAGLVVAGGPVEAANFTWTGGLFLDTNQNWGHALNWDFLSIPPNDGTADVFFQPPFGLHPNFTCILANDSGVSMNVNIHSLTFNNTASTDNWRFIDVPATLTVDSITNNNGAEHTFFTEVRTGASLMTIDAAGGNFLFGSAQYGGIFRYASNDTTVSVRGGNSVYFFNGISGSASFDNLAMSISEGTLVRIGNSSSAVDRFNITDGTLLTALSEI